MRSAILLLLIFSFTCLVQAQRTLIAPAKQEKIYPQWVAGDRDFWGHGPSVTGTVRVAVTEGKGQIIAFINIRLAETGGDGSAAEINETRLIYNAPAGKQISRIITPANTTTEFNTLLSRGGLSRISGVSRQGPVHHLMINGDGSGPDIGNNTVDDSHVSIVFNGFVVELEPLPAGVREIVLEKRVLTGFVSGKFRGTTGRLNTYGPRVGDSWFKADDSWIKFPDEIRRDRINFTQMQEVQIGSRRYYYNDINLLNIRGDANNQYLRLHVNWESNEPELRGECVNNIDCIAGTPTVQLNDLSIKINFRPFAQGNRLLYDPNDIQIDYGFNYSADCGILSALCSEIFKDPVTSAFFNARFLLASVLKDPVTVNEISNALTNGVLDYAKTFGGFPGATAVVEVVDRGAQIAIRCR